LVIAASQTMLAVDLPVVLDQVHVLVVRELVRLQQGVELVDLFLVGWDSKRGRNWRAEKYRIRKMPPLPIVIKEEEILVLDYGAANCAAELIHVERLPRDPARVVDPRVGVQVAVAEYLEGRAMEGIGPGLRYHVRDRASGASEFGRIAAAVDLEL